ncbi:MAG: hypothetical protein HRT87_08025 [Legionellales bacterium]|nr:hypothetical protein [Legionellales bacterium]
MVKKKIDDEQFEVAIHPSLIELFAKSGDVRAQQWLLDRGLKKMHGEIKRTSPRVRFNFSTKCMPDEQSIQKISVSVGD